MTRVLLISIATVALCFLAIYATMETRPAYVKEYEKCKAAGGEFMRPAVGNAGPVCAKRIPLNP